MINIEFRVKGLLFSAIVEIEPYIPAKIFGKPENCYPREGGDIRFIKLECEGTDAKFLLRSDLGYEIEVAAMDIAYKIYDSERAEAMIDDFMANSICPS